MSAYSFCTPVVVTDVGGLPEMVGNGKYGPVVPANDVEALAEKIIELVDNPSLVLNYREKIKADYYDGEKSWEIIAKDMFNIYEEIV